MIQAALDKGVPVPVLSVALYARFGSRGQANLVGHVLSAMRYQPGGYVENVSTVDGGAVAR